MTSAEAVAHDRAVICLHIDKMCANLADRTCPGFLMLADLKRWISELVLPKEK